MLKTKPSHELFQMLDSLEDQLLPYDAALQLIQRGVLR